MAGDADGVVAFNLTVRDIASNTTTVNATTNASTVRVDKGAPSLTPITIVSNNANTSYATTNDVVTIALTSNEDLSGVTVDAFTIGGGAYTNTAPAVANTDARHWTVTYTVAAGDPNGAVAFSLTGTDMASNTTNVVATTNASSVTVDKGNPVIVYDGSLPTLVANNGTVTVNFHSNEMLSLAVSNISSGTIGGASATLAYVDEAPAGQYNYTATYTVPLAEAAMTQGILAYSLTGKDYAGNLHTISGNTGTTYDREGPAVALTNNLTPANKVQVQTGNVVTITATFTDAAGTAIDETPCSEYHYY